jgi:hypothetical protein
MTITKKSAAPWPAVLIILATIFPFNLVAASRAVPPEANATGIRPRAYGARPAAFEVPTVNFKEVRLEHNVRMRGRNGMIIHVHMTVKERAGFRSVVMAYFYDITNNPVPAVGRPQIPATVGKAINPKYPSTEYKDLQIFVPTTTFHALPKGTYDLRVRLELMSDNRLVGQSPQTPEFTLTL